MVPIIALHLLLLASEPDACEKARTEYRSLALEEALRTANEAVSSDPARPLACLEVKALVHLILDQDEDAKTALVEIFERSPDYRIDDPSLSPATRETIEAIRESVRPLEAKISAAWILHESLRLDVLLEGGLRDAARVRYRTEVEPAAEVREGEVTLLGRAATATVAVTEQAIAERLHVSGQVLDRVGRVLHQFSSDIALAPRPQANVAIVEVEKDSLSWLIWVSIIGAAVIGGGIAIGVIAQPNKPNVEDDWWGRGKI